MTRQKIGQIKGPGLTLMQPGKTICPGKKFITMCAWEPLYALCLKKLIEHPPCTAVRISHKNLIKLFTCLIEFRLHGTRYFLRPIVQLRRQTLNAYMLPAIGVDQRSDFMSKRTAGNDQQRCVIGHLPNQNRSGWQ